jgi:hypothetical protein
VAHEYVAGNTATIPGDAIRGSYFLLAFFHLLGIPSDIELLVNKVL